MRTSACAAAIVLCLAGASRAQEAPPAGDHFRAEFERRPHASRGRDYYPMESIFRGGDGAALLCCLPNEDRTLSCDIAAERPQRGGFGQAGKRMIEEQQQMTADSYEAYAALGSRPRIPIATSFTTQGGQHLAVQGDTWGVCNPNRPAN